MNVLICGANALILRPFLHRYRHYFRFAGISRRLNSLPFPVNCYDLSRDVETLNTKAYLNHVFRDEPYTLIVSAWSGTPRTSAHGLEAVNHFIKNSTIQSQIAKIIRNSPPEHIIFISSAGAMYSLSEYPWSEECVSPTSIYGIQKYVAEKYYKQIASEYTIPICNLRISTAYALSNKPSNQGVVNAWLHGAANGYIEIYADLSSEINFISTSQIATALKYVIEHQLSGTFNLACQENISLQRVLESICSISRLSGKVELRHINNQKSSLYIDTTKFTSTTQLQFPPLVLQDIDYYKHQINRENID